MNWKMMGSGWTGLLVLMLALSLPAPPCGTAAEPTGASGVVFPDRSGSILLADIQVKVEAEPRRVAEFEHLARRLIGLQPGDYLTEASLNRAVESLRRSRRFSAIHVDSLPSLRGEVLVLTLTPQRFIRKISVQGNSPLFESDILRQMTLYAGNPYTRADLSFQAQSIIELYRQEGYPDPRVSVESKEIDQEGNAEILVKVDKGKPIRLGRLIFQGHLFISQDSLKWRMGLWRQSLLPGGGRFSEWYLNKDVERLLAYYRSLGFFDAELSPSIEMNEDSRLADVTVQVQEGARYSVSFSGNKQFWDFTLMEDVVLYSQESMGKSSLRKTIRNLKKRYREAGFLETAVTSRIEDEPGQEGEFRKRLWFEIQEGVQTLVTEVKIVGNRLVSDDQVGKQLLTRPPGLLDKGVFVPETLDEDEHAVTTLYTTLGFHEVKVESETRFSEDRRGVTVLLKIDEGARATVRSIAIQGTSVAPEPEMRDVLVHKVGQPFVRASMATEKEAIVALLSGKGYPYVTIEEAVSYSESHDQVDLVYTVDAGPLVILGDVFVTGNLRTDDQVIRKELEVHPPEPLSLWSLYEGQRRLRDMEIFHSVRYAPMGLKEREERVDLFVEVEENKPYYAQASTGYESDSGFYGRVQAGDRNLFGLNKNLRINGDLSQTGYRIESRLNEPRLLGTRTSAHIGVFDEEQIEFNQPFGTRTTGGSLGFGRNWGEYLSTDLGLRLQKRDRFSVEDLRFRETIGEGRTLLAATPSLRYDTRDSFVRPTSGLFSSASVDVSKGVRNQLDNFYRYLLDFRAYGTPLEGTTFAAMTRLGQVLSYSDSDQVPQDQLFFAGGIGDVRGFKENLLRFDEKGEPVGGRTMVVGSLEARVDLGMNLEMTLFMDAGSVLDAPDEDGSDRVRSSVGIGLRYITPIGPMGLLYGYKLDRMPEETAGRFHLSIGYSF